MVKNPGEDSGLQRLEEVRLLLASPSTPKESGVVTAIRTAVTANQEPGRIPPIPNYSTYWAGGPLEPAISSAFQAVESLSEDVAQRVGELQPQHVVGIHDMLVGEGVNRQTLGVMGMSLMTLMQMGRVTVNPLVQEFIDETVKIHMRQIEMDSITQSYIRRDSGKHKQQPFLGEANEAAVDIHAKMLQHPAKLNAVWDELRTHTTGKH